MKRLLVVSLALIILGLAGCEVDVDEDIRIVDGTQQIEVSVAE